MYIYSMCSVDRLQQPCDHKRDTAAQENKLIHILKLIVSRKKQLLIIEKAILLNIIQM